MYCYFYLIIIDYKNVKNYMIIIIGIFLFGNIVLKQLMKQKKRNKKKIIKIKNGMNGN